MTLVLTFPTDPWIYVAVISIISIVALVVAFLRFLLGAAPR